MERYKIRELFTNKEVLNIPTNGYAMLATAKLTEGEGCVVSVRVNYNGAWDEKSIIECNRKAYESIKEHENLFSSVTSFGISSLEDFAQNEYSSWALWIRIKDRGYGKENRLIITHGHCWDDRAAYYTAENYDEFWDIVNRLTNMYEHPEKEHEPIILKKRKNDSSGIPPVKIEVC